MAIKIDIPGLGEVTVEGLAEESTMQQILAEIAKSNKGTASKASQADNKVREAADKKAAASADKLSKALDTATASAKKASNTVAKDKESASIKATTGALDKLLKSFDKLNIATLDQIKNIKSFGTELKKIKSDDITTPAKKIGKDKEENPPVATTPAKKIGKDKEDNPAGPRLKKIVADEEKAASEKNSVMDKLVAGFKKIGVAYTDQVGKLKSFGENLSDLGKKSQQAAKDIASTAVKLASSILTTYDQMAEKPIQAAAGILQTWIDVSAQIAHLAIDLMSAVGQGVVGWIPFIGGGLAMIVDQLGEAANRIVDVVNSILTTINGVLEKEFQKRADQLFAFAGLGGSFAKGMGEMASLATASGVGIVTFTNAVKNSAEEIIGMGMTVGGATQMLSKGFAAIGKTGVRDKLLALGFSFEQQGKILAGYMAQQKAAGVNLNDLTKNQGALAAGTEDYGKKLKVIRDITGQDAQKLMDQARAEAQRGSLMVKLNALQSRAYQEAFATLAAVPNQQGPKLQAALSQMLAGGTVTDPVIAGNQIIMEMLTKTAEQINAGNTNMVVNTQKNLGLAASAYRAAGDSATDFATLMNPSGTSAVAQGMSQFGNALRQYRYDPDAAKYSMEAADAQADASNAYVGLQATMTAFQNQMEGLAGKALPAYASALQYTASTTLDFMTKGINAFTKLVTSGMSMAGQVKFISDVLGIKGKGGDSAIASKADALLPGLGGLLSAAPAGMDKKSSGKTTALAESKKETADTSFLPWAKGGVATPEAAAEALEKPKTTSAMPSAANGNILEGSTNGYAAMLHGTEAVVPLPDKRSIPVSLDSSTLTAAIQQQTTVLNQILSTMKSTNNLTSGLLQASM